MKRTMWAVAAGILASAPALWGSYTWTISRDLNTTSWGNNFDKQFLSKQTYGSYTGIGPTTAYGSMVYNGATTLGAVNMVARIPGSSSYFTFSEYIGAGIPSSGGNPVGPFIETDLVLTPGNSSIQVSYSLGAGMYTSLGGAVGNAHDNMSIMTVLGAWPGELNGYTVGVYVDNSLVFFTRLHTTTNPLAGVSGGFGVSTGPAGYLITHIDIGPVDTVSPNAIPLGNIGISPYTNHVDLQWTASTDDPNGMGLLHYEVWRNGVSIATTTGLTYSDTTVEPNTAYSYWLEVVDDFFNVAATTFPVRTPGLNTNPPYPSSTPEGRRVGMRTTGAYWGASPENIDVRSGNLNFSVPVLTAMGRAGLSASFSVSYNSQNWRKDSGGNWKFDGDVGYGFGWRLLAGSITPVWNPGGLTASYFLFMDSTGAEYRLDQNNSNVWSSKDSIYIYFDANANILHFRNGSYWYFGCVSASTEADAGVMYPTLMQDANANNQIVITYKQSSGAGWINSSARINTITDVRAISPNPSFSFNYNSDSPPHLTSITNYVGSGEGLNGTYLLSQAIASPFDGQSFGTTALVNTFTTVGGVYNFTHNGSGELTRITLPYGGYLAYDYTTMTYSSSRSYREVIRRYLSKDGSTQTTYPFSHEPSPGPDVHSYTILDDPGGVGEKYWAFSTSGTYEGLTTQYQGRQLPGPVTKTQNDFTWAQDAVGNSYIYNTLTTADPGQSYQVQKQTTQAVDIYGNVTQVQNFDWGNLTTPAKTYTYTYLTGTGSHTYITDYIMNRMTTATLYDGTYTLTLATNYYDGSNQYTTYNYGPGNLSTSTSLAGTSTASYDSYGNVTSSTNPQAVTTNATYNSSTNFAAPTQITAGSLTETLGYNSFLGLTSETGPNGDVTSVSYANISQPSQTISPFGAQTNITYAVSPNASTTTAVINGRWTRTTTDGLHRTIKVESGVGSTYTPPAVSQTDTVYDSCGCSPLGKLKQVSLPHAPGAGAVWTTYTYDGIGRTLSVLAPDGASTTTYSYQGNLVTVTDPAGAWKKYTSDAFGRLKQVEEPNPAGGSYFTTYTYDLLDHLIGVSMPRPTGTQTRTFNYIDPTTSKPGVLLRTATNPESGTVTYNYDSSNRLYSIIDAKNQAKLWTYDSLSRVTQVQRYVYSGGAYVEDPMARSNYSYDTNPYNGTYSHYTAGRLAAVQYYGGNCGYIPSGSRSGCDLIQEWYNYNIQGAMIGKKLVLARSPVSGSLAASFTVDNEGRPTGVTYPSWKSCSTCSTIPGSSYTYAYDTMGRINTMTDTVNTRTLISGMTYGVANEIQQMTSAYTTGVNTESRTYNGMFQLTQLTVGSALNISYSYSSTQNNGKITSQTDALSGEQVLYTYDSLNRLASAQTAGTGGWGQSYTYDGFGNLTDQTLIKGTAPDVHVAYNYLTNRQTGDTADANGNIGSGYVYDVDNRLVAPVAYIQYAYDPGNKRVWRVDSLGNQELSFWAGQKLATYQISVDGGGVWFTLTSTNVNFGGKLISKGTYNSSGAGDKVNLTSVVADRQGSIGKFYPYGVERPSATSNNTEKFTGYFRDADTGLDYAMNRYGQPGMGRFMTPDAFSGSAKATDPGSWNRYAYVGGDPVNRTDPSGQCSEEDWFTNCWDDFFSGCALNALSGYTCGGPSESQGDPNEQVGQTTPTVPVPQTAKAQAALTNAVKLAMRLINNNQDCADSLGYGTDSDGNLISAADVLNNLVNHTGVYGDLTVGHTTITPTPGLTVSATENAGLETVGGATVPVAFIEIIDIQGSFVGNSLHDQTVTLLHELGHAMNDIFGQGTSLIRKDGTALGTKGVGISMENTEAIDTACFKLFNPVVRLQGNVGD